jgi:gluconate 2-dehydrogenase gamma chain
VSHRQRSPAVGRRDFVIAGLTAAGAAWVAGAVACGPAPDDAPGAAHLPDHAADTSSAPRTLTALTAEQAAEVEAISARIIPSDGTPGAREAGVIHFIDAGLGTFAADQKPQVLEGLERLAREVRSRHGRQARFSALTEAQQDELLRGIEDTDFFQNLRFATLAGMFTLPRYGGNRGFVGWELIGQDNAFDHQPPFGHYDRPETQRALLGRVL